MSVPQSNIRHVEKTLTCRTACTSAGQDALNLEMSLLLLAIVGERGDITREENERNERKADPECLPESTFAESWPHRACSGQATGCAKQEACRQSAGLRANLKNFCSANQL